ncbi:DUF4347 domain-containing protein [Oscillatoria sp. FACHB-1407]|uniref:DUF4347 domain-containing protein n=1 Tax=Oscillatoria sp. FACHB-1407 TaxID=2692847 RepID=UPI00168A3572|nr:DUF4347 domain-containing protein [Oscillatoria sp. FACHB-1407]MBD2461131.1 DUF4347 domain-containing protein [Oscillatoria sp. FACHB-1407]
MPVLPGLDRHILPIKTRLNDTIEVTADYNYASSQTDSPRPLVCIDRQVPDYFKLVNGIEPDCDIALLDASEDGILQITHALQHYGLVTALHLVSHGAPGRLYLGNTELNETTIESSAAYLRQWSTLLAPDATILVYGCSVAAHDTTLLQRLHELTGRAIAASSTPTGDAAQGGNWDLDVVIGRSSIVNRRSLIEQEQPSIVNRQLSVEALTIAHEPLTIDQNRQSSIVNRQSSVEALTIDHEPLTIDQNRQSSIVNRQLSVEALTIAHEPLTIDQSSLPSSPFSPETLATYRGLLAIFTVTNTNDSGAGSLRQAILDANANGEADTIQFNIPTSDPNYNAGPPVRWTIRPTTNLPDITSQITIDAATQPGYAGTPLIELNGSLNGSPVGIGFNLRPGSDVSTVNGFVINNFGFRAFFVESNGNTFQGNYIGTDITGTVDQGNGGGFSISGNNNVIGGTGANQGNLISGNNFGIDIVGNNNTIQGNLIGTDVTGVVALGNTFEGIAFTSSTGNQIGGTTAAARNVIAGNGDYGISLITGSDNNFIQGNYIGVGLDGTTALGNANSGIYLQESSGNQIGGTAAGAGNVISSNTGAGIELFGPASTSENNIIQGNFIGTDATGTFDRGNTVDGILLRGGADNNTIGGTTAAARNIISGNNSSGVVIADSATGNEVLGNYIGTNAAGNVDLGNGLNGVFIIDAATNTVGGTAAGAGNLISGNNRNGVQIEGASATGNTVQGNFIGTDLTGNAILNNPDADGVFSNGINILAPNNLIGGTTAGARNVIGGASNSGIALQTGNATGNTVQGNFIGVGANGTANIGNTSNGVDFFNDGGSQIIGGIAAGAGNIIANNGNDGVVVLASSNNQIRGNSIFNNGQEGIDLGSDGVTFNDGGDGDSGANNLQNFPVILTATVSGSDTLITGEFNGEANSTFAIELFSNTASDPSGNGEGQTYLTTININTDSFGNATFNETLIGVDLTGLLVTATATDASNNTSEFSAAIASFSPLEVTNTNDSGPGSLQAAIDFANSNPGADTITFNIPTTDPGYNSGTGVYTIDVSSTALSLITDTVNIDGTSQPGFVDAPIIELTGGGSLNGLFFDTGSNNSSVRGLIINGFDFGITLVSDNNTVAGNYFGTNSTGTAAAASGNGVAIAVNGANNTVGGLVAADRNLISGNGSIGFGGGILISDSTATGNTVIGNFIGTNINGTAALGNVGFGIRVTNNANNNTIGGSTLEARNLISGNSGNGIEFQLFGGAFNNTVEGNYIGTNAAGTGAIANGEDGVFDGGNTNSISDNVISGNADDGIELNEANGSVIANNIIGLNANGDSNLGNGADGVNIIGSINSEVSENVISANGRYGVSISTETGTVSNNNTIIGNFIGTDSSGTVDWGNALDGLLIANSTNNTVGGLPIRARNIISGNGENGIEILDSDPFDGLSTTGNTILNNFIGTDVTGTASLGNGTNGILIGDGATNNTIGGTVGNLISGNTQDGIAITGDFANGNTISNNSILNNGQLGIDLNNDGVTANDPDDSDFGSNDLLNFPVLGTAEVSGSNTTLTGSFNSAPNTTFTIEVFSNTASDPSGRGEGETFVTSFTVTTDGTGNATISEVIPIDLSGLYLTATATDPSGNTSEFSRVTLAAASSPLVVTNTNDSGPGSLRAAINFANSNPGDDTITFNIPITDPGYSSSTDSFRINLQSDLSVGSTITIDGTSQPGFAGAPIIELDGSGISGGPGMLVLGFGSDNSIVRGLVFSNILGYGIQISSGDGHVVAGNYIGTDVTGTGTTLSSFFGTGILLSGGSNTRIGGTTASDRNLISGNVIGISINNIAENALIQGNYIGTDVTGEIALGNTVGIEFYAGSTFAPSNNIVGGTAPGAGNIIAGNTSHGIVFGENATIDTDPARGNQVVGNSIGIAANGDALGNGGAGILVEDGATEITISQNAIANNVGLGIDLGGDGVTANDLGDGDVGNNALQNFPLITNITGSNIIGSFNSTPSSNFRIEFFANASPDSSGNGEGQVYLGFQNVATDGSGNASISFAHTFDADFPYITATATNTATANTSEFSALANPLVVTNTNDSGFGSLRAAIAFANSNPGADTITFSTIASSPFADAIPDTILLTSGGFSITDDLTITGLGANLLTIQRDAGASNFRLFTIDDGTASQVTVDISGFTLRDGRGVDGGAILNRENLTISNSTIRDNVASNGGGAIWNQNSSLTIINSLITENASTAQGGSIYSESSTVNIQNSLISDNTTSGTGGGIWSGSGNLTIVSSTVSDNTASSSFSSGGGIFSGNGNLTIDSSTIANNSSGGFAAGIWHAVGTTTIRNSTISGNIVSGTSAFNAGGGVYNNSGLVTISNSTITNNTSLSGFGSGVVANRDNLARIDVVSSIIAGNVSSDVDVIGTASTTNFFFSDGNNLIGTGNALLDSGNGSGFTQPTDITGVTDPGLNPLANNGGPTQTHSLTDTSLARDAGSNPDGLTTDQRGAGFSRVVGSSADIGAFEAPEVVDPLIVTNTNDSGVGSLRAAIDFANSNPDASTITFNIPGGGVQTINLLSALPTLNSQVTIDGTTQPGFADSPLIVLNGASAGAGVNGLTLNNSNTIRGLVIQGFNGSGILISGSSNVVQGNYIGTNALGTGAIANTDNGIRISGNGNFIGGSLAGQGNVISGNGDQGIAILGNNNTVRGNIIGLAANGTAALGNLDDGILITLSASNNTIGGTTTGDRNVIGSNSNNGVSISTGAANNIVQGNYIGTAADGITARGNGIHGVSIGNGAINNAIGGTTAVSGNLIANNGADGVSVFGTSTTGNTVQGNSIFSNAGLGIDLGNNGVTANDAGDGDAGANGLQNFPVITGASSNSFFGTSLAGTLNSTATTTFRLEFFSNTTADGSGNGEGQTFLGTVDVTTDDAGNATFSPSFLTVVPQGQFITATATNLTTNETSEFSTARVVSSPLVVTNTNDSGAGSLREAIAFANSNPGADTITFNIPGSGVQTINLLSALPSITGSVTIDGTTQPGYTSTPLITLNGSGAGFGVTGLNLIAGNNTIRGLEITRFSRGIGISSSNNTIQGNSLTLNTFGISVDSGTNNQIGGTSAGAGNVISANFSTGLVINTSGTTVQGNQIQGNTVGISISAGNNTIGGEVAGAGNVITNSQDDGIAITGAGSTGNLISRNSIHNNGSIPTADDLGIDLGADGVTANDAGDGDTGANGLQNFPVITAATLDGSVTRVAGTFNSTPNTTFRLEFFSDPAPNLAGTWEGETFLGFLDVATNASGNATFNTSFATAVPLGQAITATARNLTNNNTSEFSAARVVTGIPTVTLGLTGSPLAENGGVATVTATLSNVSAQPVTVNLGFNGTATNTTDYNRSGTSIVIPAGSLTGSITLTGVNDLLDEANETIVVDILSVTNGTESGVQQVTATITDDDLPPTVSISPASIVQNEGNSGTTAYVYTVSLSAASGLPVTVNYTTNNGTATAGSDYIDNDGSLTFNPGGPLTQNITVLVNGDTTVEPTENFTVTLNSAANGTLGTSSATGTITDDDLVVSISPVTLIQSEGNSGNTAFVFTVTISNNPTSNVTVNYTTNNGTAIAGSDYTDNDSSVVFTPGGGLTRTITVNVTGDTILETNETFTVTLTSATGATIGTSTATATINNDEAIVNLSQLINSGRAVTFTGLASGDFTGGSVANAGDINGDGIDDLVIGARGANPNGRADSGSAYVVFGTTNGFPALSTLNGTNGFRIDGIAASDGLGNAVKSAGDIDNDGIDDLILGARAADPNGRSDSGQTYILFGSRSPFSSVVNPANLTPTSTTTPAGFRLTGASSFDLSGGSVSSAGDIDGDGFDDLLVGAVGGDPTSTRSNAGYAYIVFGRARNSLTANINLSTPTTNSVVRLNGIDAGDNTGYSVSNAGDINGDGRSDLIVGAINGDPNGTNSGETYVVFGSSSLKTPSGAQFNLSTLNGTNGFRLDGGAASDNSGFAVSAIGDINHDGIADLAVTAPFADPNGRSNSGAIYVVFGRTSGFSTNLNLSTLNGTNGFRLNGIDIGDFAGVSVSSAGDFNRDGVGDLLIGAPNADPNGVDSGEAYIVYGRKAGDPFAANINLSTLNGSNGIIINGLVTNSFFGYAVASGNFNGGGDTDLLIGAPGSGNGAAYAIFGTALS